MKAAHRLLLERASELRAGEPVPSPCISVCRMDAATALCEGCFRTLEEIADWSTLGEDGKRAVWRAIEERTKAAT
jgi:predicted Fe-S protein YdhL (DUF1289 family)